MVIFLEFFVFLQFSTHVRLLYIYLTLTNSMFVQRYVIVRAFVNGVNQVTYIFLEYLIPVRTFHGDVAGEIKHTNCWQSKCVLKYCAMLYMWVRFY
jgi:hypothetical protein